MTIRSAVYATGVVIYLSSVMAAPALLGANRGWSVALLAMALAASIAMISATRWSWFEFSRSEPLARMMPVLIGAFLVLLIAGAPLFLSGAGETDAIAGLIREGHRLPPDPDRVSQAVLGYLAACSSFLLGFLLVSKGQDWGRRFLFLGVGIWAAYALYSVLTDCLNLNLSFYSGNITCMGISGPFINRNNYATFAGLGLIVAALLTVEQMAKAGFLGGGTDRPLKRWVIELGDQILGRSGLLIAAVIIMGTALLLTQSRGGVFTVAIAFTVAGALLIYAGFIHWRRAIPIGVALFLPLFLVWSLAGDNLSSRIGFIGFFDETRLQLYDAAFRMIGDRPLTGHGFGAFQETIQQYRTWEMGPYPDWDKAHNSYLEIAAGIGIPGAFVFFTLFGWMLWRCIKGLIIRRRGRIFPLIGIACTVLVASHALVDFSMQIPAVAVTYTFIMGICVARSYPQGTRVP